MPDFVARQGMNEGCSPRQAWGSQLVSNSAAKDYCVLVNSAPTLGGHTLAENGVDQHQGVIESEAKLSAAFRGRQFEPDRCVAIAPRDDDGGSSVTVFSS